MFFNLRLNVPIFLRVPIWYLCLLGLLRLLEAMMCTESFRRFYLCVILYYSNFFQQDLVILFILTTRGLIAIFPLCCVRFRRVDLLECLSCFPSQLISLCFRDFQHCFHSLIGIITFMYKFRSKNFAKLGKLLNKCLSCVCGC